MIVTPFAQVGAVPLCPALGLRSWGGLPGLSSLLPPPGPGQSPHGPEQPDPPPGPRRHQVSWLQDREGEGLAWGAEI